MSNAASNFLEDNLLNHALRFSTNPYTGAATLSLALFKNTSGNALDNLEQGTLTDEIAISPATGYERQTITFDAAVAGVSANSATITFPTCVTNSFGTVTHVAIMDSDTHGAGNVLFYGAVTTAKQIDVGDTFQVSAANLTIALT